MIRKVTGVEFKVKMTRGTEIVHHCLLQHLTAIMKVQGKPNCRLSVLAVCIATIYCDCTMSVSAG